MVCFVSDRRFLSESSATIRISRLLSQSVGRYLSQSAAIPNRRSPFGRYPNPVYRVQHRLIYGASSSAGITINRLRLMSSWFSTGIGAASSGTSTFRVQNCLSKLIEMSLQVQPPKYPNRRNFAPASLPFPASSLSVFILDLCCAREGVGGVAAVFAGGALWVTPDCWC